MYTNIPMIVWRGHPKKVTIEKKSLNNFLYLKREAPVKTKADFRNSYT